MDLGIVGLPNSGKTTIFNAVTRGAVPVSSYGGHQGKPNVGVAKVPDRRLEVLSHVFRPRRTVQAEITYVDLPPPPEGFGKTRGVSGQFLSQMQLADALVIVVRAFEDPSVHHPLDTLDPVRDVETILYELAFSDMEILSRRLERIADGFKGAKSQEREALIREQELLTRIQVGLEGGTPIRDRDLDAEETRMLEGFRFLSAKPLIAVVNVGEDLASDSTSLEEGVIAAVSGPRIRVTSVCGRLEMELAHLDEAEESEFRASMGLGEPALDRMVLVSQDVLEQITFLTGNPNEVRAWTVDKGATALKAAGRVHSDFERGFIRAEVVSYEDLKSCGSLTEARGRGLLRQEGKGYLVQEGDVINILFSV